MKILYDFTTKTKIIIMKNKNVIKEWNQKEAEEELEKYNGNTQKYCSTQSSN